jgi:hypothetical protein
LNLRRRFWKSQFITSVSENHQLQLVLYKGSLGDSDMNPGLKIILYIFKVCRGGGGVKYLIENS